MVVSYRTYWLVLMQIYDVGSNNILVCSSVRDWKLKWYLLRVKCRPCPLVVTNEEDISVLQLEGKNYRAGGGCYVKAYLWFFMTHI